MAFTTAIPRPVFGPLGFVKPVESALLAGATADINGAFGGGVNPALTTPQGQLATSESAVVDDKNTQLLQLFNGMDPAFNSGRMQDGIARIYFLTRNPAEPTALQIACGGAIGVQIPVGALIKDDAGNVYACTQAGTIGPGGTVTVSFANLQTGPVAIPPTVDIYQSIPQWDTVAVVGGEEGAVVESPRDFEFRRQNSVASNGAGFLPAIIGRVFKVANVLDATARENPTGAPVVVGGVTLKKNSLYVCVAGGAAADIAAAIWTKKNPGCDYNGNTTVTVYDTNSGYQSPYPAYPVTYQVPASNAFAFSVVIANSPLVPSDAVQQIQAAVLASFLGTDNGLRARIGSTVFASRFYANVALLGTWAQIVDILLGSAAAPDASFTGTIAATVLTVSGVTGTVAIGQAVFGPGVAAGTTIVSGSGTTWAVSISQTVASAALTGVAASKYSVTLHIDQFPTLAAADVAVTLV